MSRRDVHHDVGALQRTFIVVDLLSFSTCVSVAAGRGVVVLPYASRDSGAREHAERHRAVVAGPRGAGFSLSPASLMTAPRGTSILLPSPNGATISLRAATRGHVLAGCLRNVSAVCGRAMALGGPFAVIPAGERWPDWTLRPAVEDLVGAGAVAAMLPGAASPEASVAIAAFRSAAPRLLDVLLSSSSGRELVERGYPNDVHLAAELDADGVAPELLREAFRTEDVEPG